jgi:hypothetical protein
MLPNSFYKASITLTTKQTNKKTKKKKESNISIFQMKIDAEILNKLFDNIIQ